MLGVGLMVGQWYLTASEGPEVASQEVPYAMATLVGSLGALLLAAPLVVACAYRAQREEARSAIDMTQEQLIDSRELAEKRGRKLLQLRAEQSVAALAAIRIEAVGLVKPVDALSLSSSLGLLLCGSGATIQDLRGHVPEALVNHNLASAINVASAWIRALQSLDLISESKEARSRVFIGGAPYLDSVYRWNKRGLALFKRATPSASPKS